MGLIAINHNLLAQDYDDDDDNKPANPKTAPLRPVEATDSPKQDMKLVGEWWTDSKDAIFSKITFRKDGSFSGYLISSDKSTSYVGSYILNYGEILITMTNYSPVMAYQTPPLRNIAFSSYTISDDVLQLVSMDRSKAFNYYRAAK